MFTCPMDVGLLLDAHVLANFPNTGDPHHSSHAARESIDRMLNAGVLVRHPDGRVTTSDKGKAWVEMVIATPVPEQRWVDPRDKDRISSPHYVEVPDFSDLVCGDPPTDGPTTAGVNR